MHPFGTAVYVFGIVLVALFVQTSSGADYATLDSARISQVQAMLSESPQGIGPSCSDRVAWSSPAIAPRLNVVTRSAESLLSQNFPAWDDDIYLEYSRKGSRPNGERMMNARKAWIYPLVLAECIEWKGRFVPIIERVLTELSSQPTWTWPAHDAKLRNFRDHDYEVDLLAADMANDIAQTLYMLGDKLSPGIRQKTLAAMEARIFSPLRRSFVGGKDNWWLKADHNWNAVCLKGVVAAALTVLQDRQDRALFAAAGEHYIRHYVSGFTDDGYFSEGAGYWNYGFSHFVMLREVLTQATRGGVDLFVDPKVVAMALYGVRIEMMPGNIAAFGDASPKTRMDELTLAYASQALGLGLPQRLSDLAITASQPGNASPLTEAALKVFVKPTLRQQQNNVADQIGLRSYFEKVGVLVARPAQGSANTLAVSIKAGGNGNHSHNDIGSYAIALRAEQPTGDVGATRYSSKTFSKDRYTIKAINSYGHPVPVIAGELQIEATKAKPVVLSTRFTPEADEITLDLAPAYAVSELKSLVRKLRYDRTGAGAIEIEDSFVYHSPQSFEVPLTTLGGWRASGEGRLEIWQKNERLQVKIDSSAPYELIEEKIDEEGLVFTRVAIRLRTPQRTGFIKLYMTSAIATSMTTTP